MNSAEWRALQPGDRIVQNAVTRDTDMQEKVVLAVYNSGAQVVVINGDLIDATATLRTRQGITPIYEMFDKVVP